MSSSITVGKRMVFGCLFVLALIGPTLSAMAADVYLRVKIEQPQGEKFKVAIGGWRHDGPNQWYLPNESFEAPGGQWSPWLDLTKWELHGKENRQGGVAEWPAVKLSVARAAGGEAVKGCRLQVQLADKPDEQAVVHDFTEAGASDTIAFLLPHPLRENKQEFETGTQMAARHARWAAQAAPQPVKLNKFDMLTSLWGHYDPALARQELQTLKRLGFNVVGSAPTDALQEEDLRTYTATWLLEPDPEKADAAWKNGEGAQIAKALNTEQGKWLYSHMAHYVVADEIAVIPLTGVDKDKLNGWFRQWLKERGVKDSDLPVPVAQVQYPAQVTTRSLPTLPRFATDLEPTATQPEIRKERLAQPLWLQNPPPPLSDLRTRRLYYYASKFGQEWSVKQLKHTGELIKASLPGMKTETLPTDHGFFNAWGPPTMGMSYCLLDLFEIGHRSAVDIISAEDWMGLNHMYGPNYTWTGAQSLEYLSAIMRSGIGTGSSALRTLITPSDDRYLQLKAFSSLGQGSKSFFFWTYGPTFIGTENYWSDLQSMYEGLGQFGRMLAAAEEVIYPARTVRDPVAVLYAVSHDYWHTDDPASFVEKRLTWHALRHLHVQPDFLREEDVEAGRLKDYKVLYVVDQCVTRGTSTAIDQWVKDGGVVYLAAGAATRDEFYEPFVPAFAATLWPKDAAMKLVKEKHNYNERSDLPGIKPLTMAGIVMQGKTQEIKVLGYRLDLASSGNGQGDALTGTFADGKLAAGTASYGKGWVLAAGFMPGLAYSPFKAGQTTLDEVWPAQGRMIFEAPLRLAKIEPVASASMQVVETSLLSGPQGAAVVLVNYTHKPIKELRVHVKGLNGIKQAHSSRGVKVELVNDKDGSLWLDLPLDVADIVLLTP